MLCLTASRRALQGLDLRFASHENEAAFRDAQSRAPPAALAGFAHMALELSVTWFIASSEEAFDLASAPYFLYLLIQVLAFTLTGIASTCSLLNVANRLGRCGELLWACAVSLDIIAALFQGRQGRAWLGMRLIETR
ncbi:unnamed protein product [Effrenium voratum]|nr:unnamed protein product [Effrenium voratum]